MTTINKEIKKPSKEMAVPGSPLGLYLHVPFCIQKCNYCDFLSFQSTGTKEQEAYIRSLIQEIKYYGEVYRNTYYVDTIFVGGGTPSLIEGRLIREIITAVKENFCIDKNAEISMESNPKTLTESKLHTYMEGGINRLSIGAQSFDDKLLCFLGRAHKAEDFFTNYSLVRKCGFRNVNLDLMFAIPGQTMKIWMETLRRTIELEPEHISLYSLQLEEETPFFTMFQEGTLKVMDDELDRQMYHTALEALKGSGYFHYEISNVSKDGFPCRHNLKYWSMNHYLGLGLGAHSYIDGVRFSNLTNLDHYIQAGIAANGKEINKKSLPKGLDSEESCSPFVQWIHKNSKQENISEYLFTGMRKMQGVDLNDFENKFGLIPEALYGEILRKHQQNKLIEIVDGKLRFTEKGIDISNTVFAEFV